MPVSDLANSIWELRHQKILSCPCQQLPRQVCLQQRVFTGKDDGFLPVKADELVFSFPSGTGEIQARAHQGAGCDPPRPNEVPTATLTPHREPQGLGSSTSQHFNQKQTPGSPGQRESIRRSAVPAINPTAGRRFLRTGSDLSGLWVAPQKPRLLETRLRMQRRTEQDGCCRYPQPRHPSSSSRVTQRRNPRSPLFVSCNF